MRKLLRIITFLFALPALAAKPISVDQLAQILASAHGETDTEVARQISDLRLTERVSSVRLVEMQKQMPGDRSKQALLALTDESAFLNPPASEMPAKAAPDLSEQRRIMALTVAYVSKTIPKLPNFLATRQTTRFQDSPLRQGMEDAPFTPLHAAGDSNVTVLYRDGREVVDTGTIGDQKPALPERGLRTWGEFGPILSTVLLDAAQNKLSWGHWEQGDAGPLAVFAYAVPKEKSHYEVDYCCIVNSEETRANVFHELAGYHGAMAIDVETGAIRRLTIEADLRPGEPVSRAALLVEYAPVEIGGKSFICPVRGIAVSRAQSEKREKDILVPSAPHSGAGGGAVSVVHTTSLTPGPEQTLVNDTAFVQYHMFRAESRILTGAASDLPSINAVPTDDAVPAPSNSPVGSTAAGAVKAAPVLENSAVVNPAPESAAVPTVLPASGKPPIDQPAIPEVSVATASGLPDIPSAPLPSTINSGFTLRTTSRLVDLAVVAFDKKGHPVTDLKPGDFEVYDNGQKQQVSFFSRAGGGAVLTQYLASPEQASTSDQPVYTNRTPLRTSTAEANTTVLLINAGNVAFGDLSYARQEMLRFLKVVPPDEHIGLYILESHGFQVLLEPTADHVLIAEKLTHWMPSAQDLARAQDEEERNRQQFDWVHSAKDLKYVNGNGERSPETFDNAGIGSAGKGSPSSGLTTSVDARLRDLGGNPERDCLEWLIGVSRHLATVPGHKNLVFVASDNVLADWSNNVARSEKTTKFLDPLALRAQETMNEAHVSLYPLDASQLEPGGIGADVRNRNVHQVGGSGRDTEQMGLGDAAALMRPGRVTAQMHQDTRPVQSIFRELAEATGGRALRRARDIAAELENVVADGRAAYLLSFSPDTPPDDKYHALSMRTVRPGVTLRYRTGYLYSKEPATLKERFQWAVWRPSDIDEIALVATPVKASKDGALKLTITATDIGLSPNGEFWTGKLDVFMIERDDAAQHATLNRQTVSLRLSSATYQTILKDGLIIEMPIRTALESGVLRVVVADETSGRIGTVTIPVAALDNRR